MQNVDTDEHGHQQSQPQPREICEAQLHHAVKEYVAHYHLERNHQGLGNRLLKSVGAANSNGQVVCHARLGGLLKYYSRQKAA